MVRSTQQNINIYSIILYSDVNTPQEYIYFMCGQQQYSWFLTQCSINRISKPSESLLREVTTFVPVVHRGIFLPHMTFPPPSCKIWTNAYIWCWLGNILNGIIKRSSCETSKALHSKHHNLPAWYCYLISQEKKGSIPL